MNSHRRQTLATLSVLLAAVFWGLMGLFVRTLESFGLGSLEISQLRITGGAVLVGGFLLCFHRDRLRIRLRDLPLFFGTGICSLLLFSYCYFQTITRTSLAVAGILLYTAPVFVMLMSILLFREKLTVKKLIALVLALLGCALVSGVFSGGEAVSADGLLLGIASGFCYALYSIFSRYAIRRGYGSWTITFYTFVFCAAGCAFLCDWNSIGTALSAEPSLWGWSIAMALITGFGAYLFYTAGLEHLESSRASILASAEPVVGAIVGMTVFNETPSFFTLLGIALVLSAITVLGIRTAHADSPPSEPGS